MRLFSTFMLIFALISQGAVARVHLMPTDVEVLSQSTVIDSAASGHAEDAMHCDKMAMAQSASHDCCDDAPVMDCHDANAPCEGECGHCQVFSPAGTALPSAALAALDLTAQQACSQSKSFHSVALSLDSPPPIA
ncbi:hypothetical protein [Ferrimonas pelagia]|uniref:Uncharacterized protein n=1 Tax=Ferrimonas pelagia TaxID=1177826 RepID=A0ABP9F6K1_9GAMM